MFGFIKSMFTSSPDKILDMVSGVGKFIDEAFHTDQEKAEGKLKVLDMQLKWLNATQGMNLARRYLAMMFAANFIITFQVCLWMLVFKGGVDGMVTKVIELAVAFQLGWVMVTIIVFYFGKGVLEGRK